jgi:hypothetical protein
MTVPELTFRTGADEPVTLASFLTADRLLLIFLRHLT